MFIASGWGFNGQECAFLRNAGLSPLQVVEAATANGPLTLGDRAPRSGQLRAGFDADVITLAVNPLDDLTVLGDARLVTGVWKGGVLQKPVGASEGKAGKAFATWDRA
jgi:imidazolonepropionase-like amidohydrolase